MYIAVDIYIIQKSYLGDTLNCISLRIIQLELNNLLAAYLIILPLLYEILLINITTTTLRLH